MSFDSFQLEQPLWLVVAALTAAFVLFGLLWERRRRRRALRNLASAELLPRLVTTASPIKRLVKRLMVGAAVLLTLVALARPQYGFHWQEVKREGIELMFAIDTSKSMMAQDLRPDRLTRAKLAVEDLVEKFQGDRVGLVAFAGEAFLQIPMTLDRAVFKQTLRTVKPGIVPVGGSDLASAIRTADQAFAKGDQGQRLLVLLSDGEDLEGSAVQAAKEAAEHGVVIYTVGVGGTEGEVLSISDGKGGSMIVRDSEGKPVVSALDEQTLTDIAEATGGAYMPLGADGLGLQRLYESHLQQVQRHTVESRSHRVYHDRFVWFLFPALLLLFVEPFVSERGRRRALVSATLALLVMVGSQPAAAGQQETYNEGVLAYEQGDWGAAAESFERAIGGQVLVDQQAYYNFANAQYRAGEAVLEEDVSATRALWEEALAAYDTAIELDEDDEDARFNRDFVARKLEELPEPEDSECDNPSDEEGGSSKSDDDSESEDDSDESNSDASEDGDQDPDQGDQGQDEDQGDQGQDQNQDQGDQGEDEEQGDQGQEPDQGDQGEDEDQGDQGQDQDQGDQDQGEDQAQPSGAGAPESAEEEDNGQEAGAQGEASEDEGQEAPAGLAAAASSEDGSMSPEQAAALISALGGDASTIPLFAPAPTTEDKTQKDW